MRKIVLFISVCINVLYLQSQAVAYVDSGSVLVYDILDGEQSSTFTAFIEKYDFKNEIIFRYEISGKSPIKGKIILTGTMLQSAKVYQNYFKGGEEKLTDRLAVFLSSDNYSDMVQTGKTSLDMMEGTSGSCTCSLDNFGLIFKNEEVSVNAYYCVFDQSGIGFRQVVACQLGPQPLILSLQLGFKLRLRSIE